jgi:small subunit ribosomal protein S6
MNFYEHTIITKHDLSTKDVEDVKNKYVKIINSEGKVIKTEEWGLMNFANKIKSSKKGFYLHFKFEAEPTTILDLKKEAKLDNMVIRDLIVKYKKLNLDKEYFNKEKKNSEE